MILVLDRGLVQFGKYAVAILGLVLLIGAFFLGFDLKKLVSEMQDRRVELAQAAVNLEGGKQMAEANAKQLEAQTALAKAGFKKAIDDLEAKLANADEQVTAGRPGVYCEDCNIAAPTDPESPMARYMGVNAHACDDAAAERLWDLTFEMLAAA